MKRCPAALKKNGVTTAPPLIGTSTGAGPKVKLPTRATAMMLLGEKVDAAEALRIGLVDRVVDGAELSGAVGELADRLAAGPTQAYGWIKASLQHAASADVDSTLEFEDRAQTACFASDDHLEAVAAFVQKRSPRFTGS